MNSSPTLGRAVVSLILNIIVLPGLGTIASGDAKRRPTGWIQLGISLILLPLTVASVLGSGTFSFLNNDLARAWLANFMMILALWGAGTGISIIREAKAAKRRMELASS